MMYSNGLRIRAEKRLWTDSIAVLMSRKREESDKYDVVLPIKFKAIPANIKPGPSFELTDTEAQQLVDELWNCGLRPSEGKGSAGSLKATENHLNDMRKIVFRQLNI